MKIKLLKFFILIYDIIISIFLYILLKPILVILKKILNKNNFQKLNYKLINFSNYLFFINLINRKKFNKIESDIKKYRDTYDRNGLEIYFKVLNKKELFKNKKILDLGCGVGGKCLEITNKYHPKKILGIDLSQRNIKYAKELINDNNKNILDYQYKNLLIVFNHYNDRFGSHLKEYIYHPWPQSLFEEEIIFSYWNNKLKNDPIMNEKSYFPPEYHHGTEGHNSDCFMNLNKLDIKGFEKIIEKSDLKYVKKLNYSKSIFLKIFPFLPKKYLEGSVVYHLKKS